MSGNLIRAQNTHRFSKRQKYGGRSRPKGTALKILGAGLSGLSAAINLAKAGKEVTVYEKNSGVGLQMHPNFQGLLRTKGKPLEYLNSLNMSPKFEYKNLSKMYLCTRKKEIRVNLKEPIPFVLRGGENSLEHGLFKEAEKAGAHFEFNSQRERETLKLSPPDGENVIWRHSARFTKTQNSRGTLFSICTTTGSRQSAGIST